MKCFEPSIERVCSELFHFLRSEDRSRVIHNKTITRIEKQRSCSTEITIGFMTIRMVFKPLTIEGGISTGSDEGANVFILLPFSDDGSKLGSEKLEIKCYYSERGSEHRLTASVPSEFKGTIIGPRRVSQELPITQGDPLAVRSGI